MIKAAKIASELCNKEITTEDTFKVLIALKLSRISHSLQEDSVVDTMGYLEGLWNFNKESQVLCTECCGTGKVKLLGLPAHCPSCLGVGYNKKQI